jgi:mannosyltransferase
MQNQQSSPPTETKRPSLNLRQWKLLIPLFLAFALYTFRLDAQSLWMDEIITVQRCRLSITGILNQLLETRNHVPFYFLLMHIWQKGGTGEFWIRFPSVVWALLGVAMTIRISQDIGGPRASLFAGLLLTFAPFYNWHAQDARMYTMAAFWGTAATWTLVQAWQQPTWRQWTLYGACAFAAAYTHLLIPIVFLGQAFFIIYQKNRNQISFYRWFIVMALLGMPLIVWMIVLAKSGGFTNAYINWIPKPTLMDLPLTYYVLVVGTTAGRQNPLTYLPLMFYLVLLAALLWRRQRLTHLQNLTLTLLGIPVIFVPNLVWLASQRQPVYVDRYFLPLSPSLIVLISAGLQIVSNHRRKLAWGLLTILLLFDVWSLANMHFNPRYARDDWRSAAAYIRDRATPNDALLSYADKPFEYYSSGGLTPQDAWELMEDPQQTVQIANGKERLWLVLPLTVLNNHQFYEEREQLAEAWIDKNPYVQWLMDHYTLLDSHRFPGVQVMLFKTGNPQ